MWACVNGLVILTVRGLRFGAQRGPLDSAGFGMMRWRFVYVSLEGAWLPRSRRRDI